MPLPVPGLLLAALLAALPAQAATAQDTPRTEQLQSLVQRAWEHIDLRRSSMRSRESDHGARTRALRDTLDAWNNSARTDADADALQAWLRAVIESNRLGGPGAMPAPPAFQPMEEALPQDAQAPSRPADPKSYDPQPSEPLPSPRFEPDPMELPPAAAEAPRQSPAAPAAGNDDLNDDLVDDLVDEPAASDAEWAAPSAPRARAIAAPEIDWSDPFADDPDPAAGGSGTPAERFKPVSSQSRSVNIDLLELSSRVAGYNSRLRELEGLLVGSRELTAFRLAAIVRDLEDLQDQRVFLRLYLAGLTPDEAVVGPRLARQQSLNDLASKAAERRQAELQGQRGERVEAEESILSAVERKLDELRLADAQ